jgi:hypothetical protein
MGCERHECRRALLLHKHCRVPALIHWTNQELASTTKEEDFPSRSFQVRKGVLHV